MTSIVSPNVPLSQPRGSMQDLRRRPTRPKLTPKPPMPINNAVGGVPVGRDSNPDLNPPPKPNPPCPDDASNPDLNPPPKPNPPYPDDALDPAWQASNPDLNPPPKPRPPYPDDTVDGLAVDEASNPDLHPPPKPIPPYPDDTPRIGPVQFPTVPEGSRPKKEPPPKQPPKTPPNTPSGGKPRKGKIMSMWATIDMAVLLLGVVMGFCGVEVPGVILPPTRPKPKPKPDAPGKPYGKAGGLLDPYVDHPVTLHELGRGAPGLWHLPIPAPPQSPPPDPDKNDSTLLAQTFTSWTGLYNTGLNLKAWDVVSTMLPRPRSPPTPKPMSPPRKPDNNDTAIVSVMPAGCDLGEEGMEQPSPASYAAVLKPELASATVQMLVVLEPGPAPAFTIPDSRERPSLIGAQMP